ncbi:MAG: glycosyltransferase family 2 protein [Lachnospiraceae bacterium]|nr:glycosyltransferase family 2 protein [Lachnospiraceae bacterium]
MMVDKPLVSIIMPTYNRKNVIEEAIDSCIRQTYENIEVIICDDHSTDGTEEYVQKRIQEDSRIKYYKNPDAKKGANSARNTAIRMAKGKYLAFLDTDDYLMDDSIEVRINAFKENPKVAMVYGNVYCECGKRRIKWIYHNLFKDKAVQRKFLMENLALCSQISIMFRKEILDSTGMLDESQKAWTDDGFVVSVGMRYPILHCGKFVSTARKSERSMTGNKWNMYEGCKIMVHKYKREIIRYASFRRYLLWKIRLLSAYCYAKESDCDDGIRKKIWQFMHEWIREQIRPYFKVYCE